jgi:hypothetical protein
MNKKISKVNEKYLNLIKGSIITIDEAIFLKLAHEILIATDRRYNYLKKKHDEFLDVLSSLDIIEKHLDKIVPFVDKEKKSRVTIGGIIETYAHFESEVEYAKEYFSLYGKKNQEGPKNLYLHLMCKKFITNRKVRDFAKIRNIIIEQKEGCSVTKELFVDIKTSNEISETKRQKEILRKSADRAKAYDVEEILNRTVKL